MNDSTLDDISALCSHVKVDPSRYRVFPREDKLLATSPVDSNRPGAPLALNAPAAVPLTAPGKDAGVRDHLTDVRPVPSRPPEHKSAVFALPRERRALRSLFGTEDPARFSHGPHSLEHLKSKTISVFSAAGGTGATTVTATLARLFAQDQETVVVLDGRSEGLLPFYFGPKSGTQIAPGHILHRHLSSAPIHILSNEEWPAGDDLARASANELFAKRLQHVSDRVDRILIDVWPGLDPTLCKELCGAGICLVVASPDLSSVHGVQRLEKRLQETGILTSPVYVLNKFDEGLALHRDIYDWLARRSSSASVLTIQRTDEVNEALSDGLTVVDHVPGTRITDDYLKLAAAMQEISDANLRVSIA